MEFITKNPFILTVLATLITGVLFVPFIDVLYKLKMRQQKYFNKDIYGKKTPIFDKLKKGKLGTPLGGGVLVIAIMTVVFVPLVFILGLDVQRATAIMIAFLGFGVIGFYDDLKKIFKLSGRFAEFRMRHKFVVQILVALVVSYLIVFQRLIYFDLPLLSGLAEEVVLTVISTISIAFMANAFNITDGVDGLAGGLLMIALVPLWIFAAASGMPTVGVFVALFFGCVLAFLYFNVNPARLFMGDAGALAFGAVITVLGILTGTLYLLPIWGAIFLFEALSSLLQWASKGIWGKKLFKIAPFHHHLEASGWSETKVTFRFWLAGVLLAVLSLALFGVFRGF